MIDPDMHSVAETFSQLSPKDEGILVSLPYRIGLYVSYSDVTGGWDAQERELESLTGILREFSEDFCKTEFSQKVLMETLMRRGNWPAWAQNIGAVPDEARHIVDTLVFIFSEKELRAFKEVLVDIALAVAMAFHEGREPELAPAPGLIEGIMAKLTGAKKQPSLFDHVHISPAERKALDTVCDAMNYGMKK
jgi:hypothetical protein